MKCGICSRSLAPEFAAEVHACRRSVAGLALNLEPICDACDALRIESGEMPPVHDPATGDSAAREPRHATNDHQSA